MSNPLHKMCYNVLLVNAQCSEMLAKAKKKHGIYV